MKQFSLQIQPPQIYPEIKEVGQIVPNAVRIHDYLREPVKIDQVLHFSLARALYENYHKHKSGAGRTFEMLMPQERQIFLDEVQVVIQELCAKGFTLHY